MKQSFTQNYLLEIIYGERSFKEYVELDDAFIADPALRQEFRMLYDAQQALPKLNLSPDIQSINNILNYSKIQAI